jgi:asparagine synthase (glutamine-hydrolysing)
MPGITGIIGRERADIRAESIERMLGVMTREAFYRSGLVLDDTAGIAVGWTAHAGGFAAANPVWNDARTIAMIVSGEDFTEEATIARYRRLGDPNSGHSASYLVGWYEALGLESFLRSLNGHVSGVIVDLRDNKVHLFNDRFGLARVYVHEGRDAVYFASEAKSILRVVPETRRLDPRGVAEYSACGCVLENRTLFAGMALLPAASCWTFSSGTLKGKRTYFDHAEWEDQPRLDEADYAQRLSETFARIVPKYLRGDQRIGMSLTGGIDGRMIMACADVSAGEMPCYTFGGPYRECQDVLLARRVALSCRQPHEVITVGDDFIRQFTGLAAESIYLSDGAMDVTGSVELYVNRLARGIAPIRLTGNYGSEILRSNVAFKAQPLDAKLFSKPYLALGEQASATYAEAARGRALSLITRKQVPWHHHSRLSLEQSQLTMRSPYLDNELVALAYRAPDGQEASKAPALRFVADRAAALARIPTDRGLLHRPVPVATKLNHIVQEFTFRAEYAYDYGMPQWLARLDHAAAWLHLERLFLGRQKFYHFRVWYRDLLGGPIRSVLLDPRSLARDHVSADGLEQIVKEHLAGTRNHTTAIHQAMSIEFIYRQLAERDWA